MAFAYGELVKGKSPEEVAEIDRQLTALDPKPEVLVEMELSDGRVVQISEERLAQIRANRQAMASVPRKGQEVN